MELNVIHIGAAIKKLKLLADKSVHCIVTSPPYYGLRDYNVKGQLGLEKTPEAYIRKLVLLLRECKRVLRDDGTLWLNIGDTYAAYWGQKYGQGQSLSGTRENNGSAPPAKKSRVFSKSKRNSKRYGGGNVQSAGNIKPKDLFGIPWMIAFALRKDGWYLRQDIIWHKPNPMPESVTDRCTKSHEYIFLLSKSAKYYYDQDAIRTPVKDSTVQRMMQQIEDQKGSVRVPGKTNGSMKAVGPGRTPRIGVDNKGGNQGSQNGIKAYSHRGDGDKKLTGHSGNFDSDGDLIGGGMANKKSVWTVTTMPYNQAHFATFPEKLIIDCIKAGCPEFVCNKCGKARERIVEKEYKLHENWYGDKVLQTQNSRGKAGSSYNELISITQNGLTDCGCNQGFSNGIVLDPFMGAGTTALVARKLNRNFIGIELNPAYVKIAEKRLKKELGMFL